MERRRLLGDWHVPGDDERRHGGDRHVHGKRTTVAGRPDSGADRRADRGNRRRRRLLGSVNPEGLPTTVFFQYGLDKRYSQVGASGPNYT